MYKKKKVEISFEVVEWVDDDSDTGYGNNVNEWLGHLKTLVDCLDYRVEYEIEGTNIHGDPIHGKLKNTQAKTTQCLVKNTQKKLYNYFLSKEKE